MLRTFFKSSAGRKAFTLIELLIVIAIIGVLTVAFLPTLRGGPAKARDAGKRQLVADVQNALENMINDGTELVAESGCLTVPADLANKDKTAGMIALKLGKIPQKFAPVGKGAGHLCNVDVDGARTDGDSPVNSGAYYKVFDKTSYMLAVEVENAESANVVAGQTAAHIRDDFTKTDLIAYTNGKVGDGDGKKYFYVVAK